MSKEPLVKLISKKDFKAFITDMETLMQSPICIKDAAGNVLIGSVGKTAYEYPVKYGEIRAGQVCGEKDVSTVAHLINLRLDMEHEKKSLGRELLEKYREITFYFNITEQLAGNLELKDTSRYLIAEAKRLIKTGDVTIVLLENNEKEILASSESEDYARDKLMACRSVIDSVVANVKSEVINTLPVDHRYIDGNVKVSSLICAPLAIKSKVLGVMLVSSEQPVDFTAGDLKLLSTVAYQTAAVIENAKLFARLKETIADLKQKKEELTASIKIRMEFGQIFISVVLMVCLYTFLIVMLNKINAGDGIIYIISRLIEVTFVLANVWLVFRSGLPLSSFGLTLENGKKSILESLAVSFLLMFALVVLKYYLVKTVPAFHNETVFAWQYLGWDYATYILVAPLQEFLCRGVLQGSIHRFLVGRFNWLWAVILTSSLFGVFHIHESLELGITAIIGGILWGGLYIRHKNLIGVSINHFLIGNWLGVLGLWNLITHSGTGG